MLNEETYYYENYEDDEESEEVANDAARVTQLLPLYRHVYQLMDDKLQEKSRLQQLPAKQFHQISELPEKTMRHIFETSFPDAHSDFYKAVYAVLNMISELPLQRASYASTTVSEKIKNIRQLNKRFQRLFTESDVMPMAEVMEKLLAEGLNPLIMNHIFMMKQVSKFMALEREKAEKIVT